MTIASGHGDETAKRLFIAVRSLRAVCSRLLETYVACASPGFLLLCARGAQAVLVSSHVFSNHKGGCGKTTILFHVACQYAKDHPEEKADAAPGPSAVQRGRGSGGA